MKETLENLSIEDLQKLMNEKKQVKKKDNFTKKIVTLVILLNVLFTISIFYIVLKVQYEPTSLIVAFFSFTTIELWSMSKIKRAEIKEEGVCNENRLG